MHQKLMDDLTRSYYKMYDCDVVVEEFPAAQKVKYHVIPEGVDVEAIKRKITEKGQKAADPKRTRKDVEELHNQRRREVKQLVTKEEFILSYLLDNGFAADEESAGNIMEAMSENWVIEILSEAPFDIYRGSTSIEGTKVGSSEPLKVNRSSYKNKKRAQTRADKLNQEYGANIHRVVRTPEQ
jgi:hypothetical protein